MQMCRRLVRWPEVLPGALKLTSVFTFYDVRAQNTSRLEDFSLIPRFCWNVVCCETGSTCFCKARERPVASLPLIDLSAKWCQLRQSCNAKTCVKFKTKLAEQTKSLPAALNIRRLRCSGGAAEPTSRQCY